MATVVEGDQKAPISIVITPIPGLLHFILDMYIILLGVKQGGINYHFKVFGMTRPGIEPRSSGKQIDQTVWKR